LPTQQAPGGAPTRRPGHSRSRAAPGWHGLGPKSRAWLASVGIDSPEQLAARDPFEVYRDIKAHWPGASLNLLYALIGAVENRHWREVARQERTSIVLRLEEMGLL